MMRECPLCGRKLRKRAMNYPGNIKRRTIENIKDRYVCSNCEETFSQEEIVVSESVESFDWF